MRSLLLLVLAAVVLTGSSSQAQTSSLADNTVLIVRHAEKPESGRELTTAGQARAQAYVTYFEPFTEAGLNLRVDALYAGADSDNSIRPRLTLEPLSRATGLKLNLSVGTKDPEKLVALLRSQPHGTHPLIAWRHGQIPALLQAFGASATLIPGDKWPDDTYDWVIVLAFDHNGNLLKQQLIREHLKLPTMPLQPLNPAFPQ